MYELGLNSLGSDKDPSVALDGISSDQGSASTTLSLSPLFFGGVALCIRIYHSPFIVKVTYMVQALGENVLFNM